jgi:hypothetical protein
MPTGQSPVRRCGDANAGMAIMAKHMAAAANDARGMRKVMACNGWRRIGISVGSESM